MSAAHGIASTLLGYEPIVDRNRRAIAMRFSALGRAAAPVDLAALYDEFSRLWPQDSTPVLLCDGAQTLAPALADLPAAPQVWLEVPAAMTASRTGLEQVAKMHRAGFVMALRGRPRAPLPPALQTAFRMSIIGVDEDRRMRDFALDGTRAFVRSIPYAQAGVSSISVLERSFETGAFACIGWPFDDALNHATRSASSPDFATITTLLRMIELDADPAEFELTIRRDAALAYRLLRYINSAAFGLTVEIQSFRHAVMMLGYERLKRWLLLMLSTASKDANMKPVMFASFRRGLFLERIVGHDSDPALRDEVFILGVLSLLDKLFREPMQTLLEKLYVPDSIREALLGGTGQLAPYLRLAQALERLPGAHLLECLDEAFISLEQCNQALIQAVSVKEIAQV